MLSSSRCRKKSTGLESSGSWSVEPTGPEKGSGTGAMSLEQSTGCHAGGIEPALLPDWMIPLGLNDPPRFAITYDDFFLYNIFIIIIPTCITPIWSFRRTRTVI